MVRDFICMDTGNAKNRTSRKYLVHNFICTDTEMVTIEQGENSGASFQ